MPKEKKIPKPNLVRINSRIREDQKQFIKDGVKNKIAKSEGEVHRIMLDFYITNKKK